MGGAAAAAARVKVRGHRGVDEDHKRKVLLSSSVSTKLERRLSFFGKRTSRCGEALARGAREDVARARGLWRIVDLGPGASRSQG